MFNAAFKMDWKYLFPMLWLLYAIDVYGGSEIPENIRFTHLTTEDGLSQSTATSILKDRYGFMWFGTMDGLNKFDGYTFHVYRNVPDDKYSLPNNQIKTLYEDSEGNLWIGTMGGGLCRYDRKHDQFEPYYLSGKIDKDRNVSVTAIGEDANDKLWIGTYTDIYSLNKKNGKLSVYKLKDRDGQLFSPFTITSILQDDHKKLWIGSKSGIYLVDLEAASFKELSSQSNKFAAIAGHSVNALHKDASGCIWIATDKGLHVYDPSSISLRSFVHSKLQDESVFLDVITTICKADGDNLWVGTEESLEYFDVKNETFRHHRNHVNDEASINHNSISALYYDKQGILWVGTYAGGINKYDANQTLFQQVHSDVVTDGFSKSGVTSFAELKNGDIWVGTDGGSLNLWHRKTTRFTHYDPQHPSGFGSYSVLCLLTDQNEDYLWIGTYGKGLKRLHIPSNRFEHINKGPGENELSDHSIYALHQDRSGNIWIGTNNGGVNVLNPHSGQIRKFKAEDISNQLSNNCIRSFYEDTEGNMWIGTYYGGISIYNPDLDHFTTLNSANSKLSSDVVFSIFCDSDNQIWVGTMGGGLCKYDRKTKTFLAFTESDGLPSNIVNSIHEGLTGELWISTNKGVSCFDRYQSRFKNYSIDHGLQGNEFLYGAGYKTKAGEILFGGINGFNVLSPDHMVTNHHKPSVMFTDFQLFGQDHAGSMALLKQHINLTKEIDLNYDQSAFTIRFSALAYTLSKKNTYAYKMEGFDKDWIQAGENRAATYTNLDPGNYTFKVRAANNDGLWSNEEASLAIHISPPLWKSNMAYIIYIVLFATAIYILYLELKAREKLKSQILFERLSAKKTAELNQAKAHFFTNVSHELRTPLSLILDPVRKILRGPISPEQTHNYAQLIHKNAEKLAYLVNELLDYRKLESGKLVLTVHEIELISWMRGVTEPFHEHASNRDIHFAFETDYVDLRVKVDPEKLEKVIVNLLSNAFKYTPDGGGILLCVAIVEKKTDEEMRPYLELRVQDTGIGIPQEAEDKIFDLFYQVEGVSPFENTSSGIGLSLTKELVLLHNGEIKVDSNRGKGTCFTVQLPMDRTVKPAYLPSKTPIQLEKTEIDVRQISRVQSEDMDSSYEQRDGKHLILIIEDNDDLRRYISSELDHYFEVLQAKNGREGYELAVQTIPDVVVSDIMMPIMDGIVCCKHLKEDDRTSHIPVILLTAKQTDLDKIEGYQAGADAYIAKPFSVDLLHTRIDNLLKSRKMLRGLTSEKMEDAALSLQLSDRDKAFLEKARTLVEANTGAISCTVDQLAENLSMSRRQLYRKLKALTNQSVQDFISGICMQKAAELLLDTQYNIAEIAYQVGFSEPSNFSRSFSKQFGMSPTKYMQQHRREKTIK